jgi:hypothetical protein
VAARSLALGIRSQTGSGIRSDRPLERWAEVSVLSDRPGHSLEIAGLVAMAGMVTATAEAMGAGVAVGAEEDGDGAGDRPGASAGDGGGRGLGDGDGAGQCILTHTPIGVLTLTDTRRAAIMTTGLPMPRPMTTQIVPITALMRPTRATTEIHRIRPRRRCSALRRPQRLM